VILLKANTAFGFQSWKNKSLPPRVDADDSVCLDTAAALSTGNGVGWRSPTH
jgi:hypothetical protein